MGPRRKTETDDFFTSILENIAEGIVVIGLDKKIIYINRTARNLIGLQNEAVGGRPCMEIFRTELCSHSCPLDSDKHISCASHFMNVKMYKREDTDSIPLCLNVAPLESSTGKPIGIIENFRPMSEAVRIIETLEKSNVILSQEKNKISSIIDSLADGVFTVDRTLRITSFNRGMERLTGQTEQEAIGRDCRDVLCADNCGSNCPLSYTLKNGYGLANFMERIAGNSGNIIPVYMSTAFLKDGTEERGLIATIRDASEIENLKKEMNDRYQFSNIIGKSVPLQQIFELIEALRDTDCAVLIEGESGTGKELVARAIHHESERRNKPFIKVNCSAIVEGLFESELFGHVKGAFTGAIKDKEGKFELADGGSIFLDEIGEMPMSLQSKLLRVIQDMEFERVGDTRTRKVDVRVIAATNRDLQEEIGACNFRDDLYYRLCIVPVKMPPLRERREDIPLLVRHFLEKCSIKSPNRPVIEEVTPAAMSALMDYHWPGNIRELENAVEHAFIRSKRTVIELESLPSSVRTIAVSESPGLKSLMSGQTVGENNIRQILSQYHGSKSKTAKALGLSRTTLWRKLKQNDVQ
ncbi:MAG: sigma 54-interacting transcriptional regulator [Nitrospirae bacterium]|nr:sigma 54-interacting transcriptional regulator [Nitrospirota bacterium]